MSPTNVLWVIDHVCYDGSLHGGGRLYWNILPRLNPERVRVVACLLRASEEIRQVLAQSPFPVRILDKGKFDPTTLWTFLRLIRKERIQVMHLHCYASSTFGRLAGLLTHVPTIIHDYDTEVYFPYPSYLSLADRWLAPSTEGAIAASPMVRDFMVRKRKIADEKIRMMFHAIPMEKYNPIENEKTERIRAQLGIRKESRVIGTVTKLGPQRGNEDLIRAFAKVGKAVPGAKLLLIYKVTHFHRLPNRKYVEVSKADRDSLVTDLRILADQLGVTEDIQFIESPENLDELVSACDIIVVPFRSERFSSVHLLESMAQGKPLIATNLGEQREIVRSGVNGYLVSPGNSDELSDMLVRLFQDPIKFNQLSRQAESTARQYSIDAYARTLEEWYADLADAGEQRLKPKEAD